MDINEFIKLQIAQSKRPESPESRVPGYLIIPGYLQSGIKSTKAKSEAEVLERGNCLSWNPTIEKLALSTPDVIGKFDALDLKLPDTHSALGFIGTYHNHPYEKRYGADYALGPSSGDWLGWSKFFPVHRPLSVNIVTSGKQVFVAFLLKKLVTEPSSDHGDIDTFSEQRSEYITSDLEQGVAYGEAIQGKRWHEERQFYQDVREEHKVDLPRVHQQDVERMNLSYTQKNPGFALYSGNLADAVCKVTIVAHHPLLSHLDNIQSGDGNACYSCGQKRTHDNPSYFAQWHRCPKCKAVFCPQHGKILPGNHYFSRARNCAACDTRTMLF